MPVERGIVIEILLIIILILVLFLGLAYFRVSPLAGQGDKGWLRRCKFNESTAQYDRCYWIWDPALKQPSIYF